MKKANIKYYGQQYNGFIIIEDMSDLIDFRHEVTYGKTKQSARSLVDRFQDKQNRKSVSHVTDAITHAVEITHELKPQGVLFIQAKIMAEYANDQDKIILNGGKIAINPFNMVSYFGLSENAEIEIISEREKYTKDDIKIGRWPGGVHWYAKVGFMDVVIDGEQKWNARWVAEQKAEQFLNELNQEPKSRVG